MNNQNNEINNQENINTINGTPTPVVPQPVMNQQQTTLATLTKTETNTTNEVEKDFVEPGKSYAGVIVTLLLIILIGGLGAYYYFVLDDPKTIFTKASNEVLSKVNVNASDIGADYTLGVKLTAESDDGKELLDIIHADIINNVRLEGTTGTKNDSTMFSGSINYSDKKLVDYDLLVDNKNNIYAKIDELYDKTIKLNSDSDSEYVNPIDDINKEDYIYIANASKKALNYAIENGIYNKEITKLNNKYVKRLVLLVDDNFITNIYNTLLNDKEFIERCAEMLSMTTEEVSDELNEAIENTKGMNDTLSIYLSLLTNDLIEIEYISDEYGMTVTKDNDTYNYVLSDMNKSLVEGYVKINKVGNKDVIGFNIKFVESTIMADVNLSYAKNDNIKLLDTTDAINYEDITDKERQDIVGKLEENEAFIKLREDIGADTSPEEFVSKI